MKTEVSKHINPRAAKYERAYIYHCSIDGTAPAYLLLCRVWSSVSLTWAALFWAARFDCDSSRLAFRPSAFGSSASSGADEFGGMGTALGCSGGG